MGMNTDDEPRKVPRPRTKRGGYAATDGPTRAELNPPPDAMPVDAQDETEDAQPKGAE